jgi:hypothetical protein
MNKICTKCKKELPESTFSKKDSSDKRKSKCNRCRYKDRKENNPEWEFYKNIKNRYNLSKTEYDKMFNEQESSCKICKTNIKYLNRGLMVDHCHITNKVRGLLCNNCNTILGMAKDNIETLKECINYLEE